MPHPCIYVEPYMCIKIHMSDLGGNLHLDGRATLKFALRRRRETISPRSLRTLTRATREALISELNFFRAITRKVRFKRYSGEAFAATVAAVAPRRNATVRPRRRNKNYHRHMWIPPRNGLSHEHFVFALLFLLLRPGPLLSSPIFP